MNIFYLPDATIGLIDLPEDESKHCVRVLRMREGDKVMITNGKGKMMEGVLRLAHPRSAQLEVLNEQEGDDGWPYSIKISVALPKNSDRLEWFLEKSTEAGIDVISLFQSQHSERQYIRTERLERVIVSAMKQSLKSRLPELRAVVPFDDLIRQSFVGQKFIAWISPEVTQSLVNLVVPGENVWVLIGPEGDFSREEIGLAIENGFVPVSLGKARLRTETAALVSCLSVHFKNQLA